MKTPDEKLTLKLKRSSIARAKAAAKRRGSSVSRMVEEYFDGMDFQVPIAREGSATPIVDYFVALAKERGAVQGDWRKARMDRLKKKLGY
jgi:hypothetical protein